jgi:dethiobiotin synthetase
MSDAKLGAAILITGTGLGVGKTFVTAGIARALRGRGVDVGVMKPVEVGWDSETDGEWPFDADALRQAAGVDDPREDVIPYIFKPFVSPQVAAHLEKRPIEMNVIHSALHRLREKHEVVLVEGVGGLAVPLDEGIDLATMAEHCGLPVLVVARAHLGTLNDTFLTVHYARSRGLDVIGVVTNLYDSSVEDETTPSNVPMIEQMCQLKVFGRLPLQPDADTFDEVMKSCNSCLNLDGLIEAMGIAPTTPA